MQAIILTLLEDDRHSAEVIASLEQSGYAVVLCRSFLEAIDILELRQVDLIVSDVHLGNGGSVFDFLRWVKRHPALGDTPFVLFSAQPTAMAKYVEDGIRTSARLLGSSMYISFEIFDAIHFCNLIESVVARGPQRAIVSD